MKSDGRIIISTNPREKKEQKCGSLVYVKFEDRMLENWVTSLDPKKESSV